MDLYAAIAEFHEHFDLLPLGARRVKPNASKVLLGASAKAEVQYKKQSWFLTNVLHEFRMKFIQEELDEYGVASAVANRAGQLDALVDMIYVILGTMYLQNIRPEHPIVGIDFTADTGIIPFDGQPFDEFRKRMADHINVHVALQGVSIRGQSRCLEDMICDVMFVTKFQGFNFREAFKRVHEANMKKVRSKNPNETGDRGSSFDIVKPKGWLAPDLSDLVEVKH